MKSRRFFDQRSTGEIMKFKRFLKTIVWAHEKTGKSYAEIVGEVMHHWENQNKMFLLMDN